MAEYGAQASILSLMRQLGHEVNHLSTLPQGIRRELKFPHGHHLHSTSETVVIQSKYKT